MNSIFELIQMFLRRAICVSALPSVCHLMCVITSSWTWHPLTLHCPYIALTERTSTFCSLDQSSCSPDRYRCSPDLSCVLAYTAGAAYDIRHLVFKWDVLRKPSLLHIHEDTKGCSYLSQHSVSWVVCPWNTFTPAHTWQRQGCVLFAHSGETD